MTESEAISARRPFDVKRFLGEKLLTNPKVSKSTENLLKGKELIGLYFSASWCPPCKTFSPILKNFYESQKDGILEIVYVSSDRTIPNFEEYYKTMPWLAIPSERGSTDIKQRLANTFGIMGIPSLIIIDAKTGEFISAAGRDEVAKAQSPSDYEKVVKSWQTAERRPQSEAAGAASSSGGLLMRVLMYFARNPMFLIGVLYIYKWAKKKIAGEEQEL